MRNTADVTGAKLITVYPRCNVINPLVAFYDIRAWKRDVLFFYFVPDTTRFLILYASK
jgi:hypothetical protein